MGKQKNLQRNQRSENMKFIDEFKEFAMRGNVIDLAIGIIIGASFGKIVSSIVSDVLMPVIGLFVGGVDFSNLFITLSHGQYATLAEAKEAGASTLNYGLFLNALIDFAIVAFAIFLMVKQINKMKKEKPKADSNDKECQFCLSRIPVNAVKCVFCTADLKEKK